MNKNKKSNRGGNMTIVSVVPETHFRLSLYRAKNRLKTLSSAIEDLLNKAEIKDEGS